MYPRILKKQKHFNCKSVHLLTTLAKLSQIPKEISLNSRRKVTRCREVNISTTRLLLSEATGGRRQKSDIPTMQE